MLNETYKNEVINDLEKIDREYRQIFKKCISNMERLLLSRKMSVRTIQNVERYVISLANRPRNFDVKIGNIKVKYTEFVNMCREIQEVETDRIRGGGASLLGISSSATISVAMVLGTRSTIPALATLSGATSISTALSWIGGGAITTGGLGITAGQLFSVMSGPIGFVLGGGSLIGSLIKINMSNKAVAEKAKNSIIIIKKEIERIKEINQQILIWNDETKKLSNAISLHLNKLRMNRKRNYELFTDDEMNELLVLFNTTEVLSKKINETIDER